MIIIYGIIGIVFFFIAVIVRWSSVFTVKGLLRTVSALLDDSVKPTVDSIKGRRTPFAGQPSSLAERAVTPIVAHLRHVAGVRKGWAFCGLEPPSRAKGR